MSIVSSIRRTRRDDRRRERGATAVEFALILPVFLTLVMGSIDWGYYFFVQQIATNAAREGARAGTVIDPGTDFENEATAEDAACDAAWDYLVGARLASGSPNCQSVGSGSPCAGSVSSPTVCRGYVSKGSGTPCIDEEIPTDPDAICVGIALPVGDRGSLSGMLSAIMPDNVRAKAFMRWE
jgi:hypothetical protein